MIPANFRGVSIRLDAAQSILDLLRALRTLTPQRHAPLELAINDLACEIQRVGGPVIGNDGELCLCGHTRHGHKGADGAGRCLLGCGGCAGFTNADATAAAR